MKVLDILPAIKLKQFGQKLRFSRKPLPDIVELNTSNRLASPKNKKECIKYAQMYINGSGVYPNMRSPFLDKLCAIMMGLSTSPKNLKIIKNQEGKIVGGYSGMMRKCDEFIVTSVAVSKPGRAAKILPKIHKDIVNTAGKNNAKTISCLVDERSPYLVRLYKKLGFELKGAADPLEFDYDEGKTLYYMTMNANDFCKIL